MINMMHRQGYQVGTGPDSGGYRSHFELFEAINLIWDHYSFITKGTVYSLNMHTNSELMRCLLDSQADAFAYDQ